MRKKQGKNCSFFLESSKNIPIVDLDGSRIKLESIISGHKRLDLYRSVSRDTSADPVPINIHQSPNRQEPEDIGNARQHGGRKRDAKPRDQFVDTEGKTCSLFQNGSSNARWLNSIRIFVNYISNYSCENCFQFNPIDKTTTI